MPDPTKPSHQNVQHDRIESSHRRLRSAVENATMPSADAIPALYERAIDRMLTASERVTSAAEGKALLASKEGTEAVAGHLQRVVVLAAPVVRTVAKGARFTRVPWVLLGTTAVSTGLTLNTGSARGTGARLPAGSPDRGDDGTASRPGAREEAHGRALPGTETGARTVRSPLAAPPPHQAVAPPRCLRPEDRQGRDEGPRGGRTPRCRPADRSMGRARHSVVAAALFLRVARLWPTTRVSLTSASLCHSRQTLQSN